MLTTNELEAERQANIEYLDAILEAWRSPTRRLKKIFIFICVLAVISVYFLATYLLGQILGYIATISMLCVAFYCANQLALSFNVKTMPDEKYALQACYTMDILIAISKGNYRKHGAHILCSGIGKHHVLYKQFIQLYPQYKCKSLERLSKIEIKLEDL